MHMQTYCKMHTYRSFRDPLAKQNLCVPTEICLAVYCMMCVVGIRLCILCALLLPLMARITPYYLDLAIQNI